MTPERGVGWTNSGRLIRRMTEMESAWERKMESYFLRTPKQINHPIRKMIIERGMGKTVLDGGCASCIDYPLWKERGFKYTGLDFTPRFLKYAKELYPEINVVGGDLANIPFGNKSFHTSVNKDIWEHQPPEKYIAVCNEVWRVTENRMMIAFYLAPWDEPTKYELVDDLFYKNHYNKQDVMVLLNSLDDARITDIIEEIGFNHSALYVVDRVPS